MRCALCIASTNVAHVNATKEKLLAAAESHFLDKGYCATTVEDICKAAGTTKGAFFHHFDNKLAVALEAVELHAARRYDAFLGWPTGEATAKDRVLAYVDGMSNMACATARPACLVATLTLELSDVSPEVQERCRTAFERWTQDLTRLFAEACDGPDCPSAEELSALVMSTFQGSMVVARALRQPQVIEQAMGTLRTHLDKILPSKAA